MKKLSAYKGEDALELWADLLDPFIAIVGDKKIATMLRSKMPPIATAREIIKTYKKEASQILLRIDDTPLDGLNIITRLVTLITEIVNDKTLQGFFGLSAEGKKEETSSGNVTEITEAEETSTDS